MLLYIWKNGEELVFRYKKDYFSLDRIGDTNSYGWVLVSVQGIYNRRFYDYEYIKKVRFLVYERGKKMREIKNFFKRNWLDLFMCCLLISFMAFLIISRGG